MSGSGLDRLETQLINIAARQSAHEFLLEFIFSSALLDKPLAQHKAVFAKLREIADMQFGGAPDADAMTLRVCAQALFNISNFVEKLERQAIDIAGRASRPGSNP